MACGFPFSRNFPRRNTGTHFAHKAPCYRLRGKHHSGNERQAHEAAKTAQGGPRVTRKVKSNNNFPGVRGWHAAISEQPEQLRSSIELLSNDMLLQKQRSTMVDVPTEQKAEGRRKRGSY